MMEWKNWVGQPWLRELCHLRPWHSSEGAPGVGTNYQVAQEPQDQPNWEPQYAGTQPSSLHSDEHSLSPDTVSGRVLEEF